MIVKIQRALTEAPSLLIYSKPIPDGEYGTHEIFAQIPTTEQEIVTILGEELKGYFEVEENEADVIGVLVVGKRVPDQDW